MLQLWASLNALRMEDTMTYIRCGSSGKQYLHPLCKDTHPADDGAKYRSSSLSDGRITVEVNGVKICTKCGLPYNS